LFSKKIAYPSQPTNTKCSKCNGFGHTKNSKMCPKYYITKESRTEDRKTTVEGYYNYSSRESIKTSSRRR